MMKNTCEAFLAIILICFLGEIWAQSGQVDPIGKLTTDFDVPTNGGVRLQTTPPASPFPSPQITSPAVTSNFLGLGDDDTSIPPDTHGAVGPSHVMTML